MLFAPLLNTSGVSGPACKLWLWGCCTVGFGQTASACCAPERSDRFVSLSGLVAGLLIDDRWPKGIDVSSHKASAQPTHIQPGSACTWNSSPRGSLQEFLPDAPLPEVRRKVQGGSLDNRPAEKLAVKKQKLPKCAVRLGKIASVRPPREGWGWHHAFKAASSCVEAFWGFWQARSLRAWRSIARKRAVRSL